MKDLVVTSKQTQNFQFCKFDMIQDTLKLYKRLKYWLWAFAKYFMMIFETYRIVKFSANFGRFSKYNFQTQLTTYYVAFKTYL